MKKYLLVLVFIPFFGYAQEQSLSKMVDDFCQESQKIKWENRSVEGLSMQVADIAKAVRAKNANAVLAFKEEYKKTHPHSTYYEQEAAMQTALVAQLIDGCDSYIKLTRQMLEPCPQENPALKMLNEKITEAYEQNKDKEIRDQILVFYNLIDEFPKTHQTLFEQSYPEDTLSVNFQEVAHDYLMQKNDPYLKTYVLAQSL